MDSSVLAAIIGVAGVIVGVGIGETLQWIRQRKSDRERHLALRGCLIGLYHEMRQNRILAEHLEKLEISTYAHDPAIVRIIMLGDARRYYAVLETSLVEAIEAAYADLQELVHLVDAGGSGEHKKWLTRGTEVCTAVDSAMKQLRQKLSALGVELTAPPNKAIQTDAASPRR